MHRSLLRHVFAGLLLLTVACGGGEGAAPPSNTPARIWGVTVDRVEPLHDIADAVVSLPKRITVRVVLDDAKDVSPATYRDLIQALTPKADVMAELEDSFNIKSIGLDELKTKTTLYLNAFENQVAIWEVGNEVNGDWLGDEVPEKVTALFDLVKARGKKTALTLYYDGNGTMSAEDYMVYWPQHHLPVRVLKGVDFVFVSYYEDDNTSNPQPNWPRIFQRLGEVFPNSLLGIGECGTQKAGTQAALLHKYYGMQLDHPRFVGGYFWWYFTQDMVPKSKDLWKTLYNELASAPSAVAPKQLGR